MPRSGDQHPVGDLGPDGTHPAFGTGVRLRAARRDLHHLDPGAYQHRVKRLGELPGPVPDQEPEPGGALPQVHQQIPCLLHRPRPVGVCGHAQNADVAGADLDHEEHLDPTQGHRAVDVEEIAGQHRGGLGTRELPPRRAAAPWRGRDPKPPQYPPHRGCTDPVPEAEQLTLDPLVAPARVLPRHLLDQRREPGVDRRPPSLGRIGPVPADQPPVPPQQRVRRHEPTHPRRSGSSQARAASTSRSAQSSLGRGFCRRSTASS